MTIPKECKRLAEVDFPIAKVSRHAVREKSIRRGHPSTLHLWWARRPLASSRAMLLPDPADRLCPGEFRTQCRAALLNLPGRPGGWDAELQTDAGLRRALLDFIANFANWDHATNPAYLAVGRALVQAAHPEETPLVVDPFAGGGSIPLEALRLGCDAFASDLNPVAVLILKTLLEDIPRRGPELADELRAAGAEIKAQAEAELADLYPPDPDGATPIAYLWARTVRCESPNCGAEIPLLRSLWLCRKPRRKWALCPDIIRETGAPPRVEFAIFAPTADREVAGGTVTRAKATCLGCRTVLPPERVRAQLAAQRGGGDVVFDEQGNRAGGARMTAVVTLKPGATGRHYRLPADADYAAVRRAQQRVAQLLADWERNGRQGLCPVPDEPMPTIGTLGFRVQRYGMMQWGDRFTARQNVALENLTGLTANLPDGSYQTLIALLIGKMADGNNSLVQWLTDSENPAHLFARQAIPIVWDFCESTPASTSRGVFLSGINAACEVIDRLAAVTPGTAQQADAISHPLPDLSATVWLTDPPYYDAIPYADLSDFFLVWLKRSVPEHPLVRDYLVPDNPLAPKAEEVVQDETKLYDGQPKNRQWFEDQMASAFAEGRRILNEDGVGSVVFAHKTTAGWEALLSGMIRGGWTITGSWPIATEQQQRLRARESAALATSVHLVCRPRPVDAGVGDWSQVSGELPVRVGEWMERLQGEGIKGADLVFACIGPALEIFSRYSAVETPAGAVVELPEYLEKVWEVVGRAALEQVLGTPESRARNDVVGALEEDARLTALFLWTLQGSGSDEARNDDQPTYAGDAGETDAGGRPQKGYQMPYDLARQFAQPLGIHLDEWKSRIIDIDKGAVRLLPVVARAGQLFGAAGSSALADEIETSAVASPQLGLFPETESPARPRGRQIREAAGGDRPGGVSAGGDRPGGVSAGRRATTLDRVHAAMLFQHSGHSQALRALIRSEQEKGPDFLRLANALSALYPNGSPEKRLLDAMLLAAPR